MYSDRSTRFYRNYDEAKVASVPKPCGNPKQPAAEPRRRSDDRRVDGRVEPVDSASPRRERWRAARRWREPPRRRNFKPATRDGVDYGKIGPGDSRWSRSPDVRGNRRTRRLPATLLQKYKGKEEQLLGHGQVRRRADPRTTPRRGGDGRGGRRAPARRAGQERRLRRRRSTTRTCSRARTRPATSEEPFVRGVRCFFFDAATSDGVLLRSGKKKAVTSVGIRHRRDSTPSSRRGDGATPDLPAFARRRTRSRSPRSSR